MEQLFDVSLLSSTIRMVAPILLAALGGMLCTRVGIFNVGLEGLIITGAFTAVVGNYYTHSLILAVLMAAVSSVLLSLLFGFMTIKMKANEIVVGVAINFLGLGLTTFFLRTIFHVKGAYYNKDMEGLPHWKIPVIEKIPFLGDVFSGHSPLVYLATILALLFYIFFYKTVAGFRMLAVGFNASASKTVGIKVQAWQYLAIALCGALCGLAGAQLSLGQVTMFSEGMSSGRGFIALVAMMLGQSQPIGVLASSLLFGLMDALSTRLQGLSVPTQFTMMIPFVLTLLAMFFLKDKGVDQNQSGQQSSR
ncbi:ABC transporter permease [Bacillus salipaludis]|uniref:ABC transporter permease n=1 Tax=Bacillus salipaludis TaxID=2547811 RepID=UPI003D202D7C